MSEEVVEIVGGVGDLEDGQYVFFSFLLGVNIYQFHIYMLFYK